MRSRVGGGDRRTARAAGAARRHGFGGLSGLPGGSPWARVGVPSDWGGGVCARGPFPFPFPFACDGDPCARVALPFDGGGVPWARVALPFDCDGDPCARVALPFAWAGAP